MTAINVTAIAPRVQWSKKTLDDLNTFPISANWAKNSAGTNDEERSQQQRQTLTIRSCNFICQSMKFEHPKLPHTVHENDLPATSIRKTFKTACIDLWHCQVLLVLGDNTYRSSPKPSFMTAHQCHCDSAMGAIGQRKHLI